MRNLGYRQLEELADSALISPRARQTPREFRGWGGIFNRADRVRDHGQGSVGCGPLGFPLLSGIFWPGNWNALVKKSVRRNKWFPLFLVLTGGVYSSVRGLTVLPPNSLEDHKKSDCDGGRQGLPTTSTQILPT